MKNDQVYLLAPIKYLTEDLRAAKTGLEIARKDTRDTYDRHKNEMEKVQKTFSFYLGQVEKLENELHEASEKFFKEIAIG